MRHSISQKSAYLSPSQIDVLAGAAPEVAITGFADGDKLAFGSTIAVPIRVTPLDSSSTMSVELFANGVSQGFAPSASAPYSVNYTVDQTGPIELFAVATETLPNSSTATRRSATVRLIGAVGQAPVVSAVQVPVSTVTLGNTVTLSVTAGDSDGTIQSLRLLQRRRVARCGHAEWRQHLHASVDAKCSGYLCSECDCYKTTSSLLEQARLQPL